MTKKNRTGFCRNKYAHLGIEEPNNCIYLAWTPLGSHKMSFVFYKRPQNLIFIVG